MTPNHSVKLSEYQALAGFRYQLRRFVRFAGEAARQTGLEPQHHQLMLAIKGRPDRAEPRIAYLAERLQIQHHSAVELVDRLVKKGLVKRTRARGDRREVHVQLTARGESILGQLTLHTRAELQSAAPALVAALGELTARGAGPGGLSPTKTTPASAKAGACPGRSAHDGKNKGLGPAQLKLRSFKTAPARRAK